MKIFPSWKHVVFELTFASSFNSVTSLMDFKTSVATPLRMRASCIQKQISTVNGMLSIIIVTLSELKSPCPWKRLRTMISKSILHAAYSIDVTANDCLGNDLERCLPQFHFVEESEDAVDDFWELCKETAYLGEAVAIIDLDDTKRSMLYGLLVAKAAKELREAATYLEEEIENLEPEDMIEQYELDCETCGKKCKKHDSVGNADGRNVHAARFGVHAVPVALTNIPFVVVASEMAII